MRSPFAAIGERPLPAVLPRGRMRSVLRSVFARLGLVDLERLAVHVAAVETGDRRARFVGVAELDEAEALRLTARTLGGDVCRHQRAVRRGEVAELRIGDLLGEISYIQFHLKLLAGRAGRSPRTDAKDT